MTIYQVTKEYLIQHFDPNCHTCNFTDEHTAELNARIHAIDPSYQAKNFDKKEQVRLAFMDFYIDVAKVTLFFKGLDKIIVKMTPYETHPDEHAFIAKIGAYVQSIVVDLDEVNDKEDILQIPEEYLQTMYAMLQSISIPIDVRQLIRRAIHDAFKLNEKDMILFINKKVIIRFYCEDRENAEVSDISCERRFEGLPEEEVETVINSLYPEGGESDLVSDIEMVMSTLMDTSLNFGKIDNHAFITHHIKVIQNALVNFMNTKLSHPEIVIKGVAKYILREAFVLIHELLAEKLLEMVGRKNREAEKFLQFYNGEVVIQNGKKFVTPRVIDENHHHWNLSAITGFMTKYAKESGRLKEKEAGLLAQAKDREELLSEYQHAVEEEKVLLGDIAKAHGEFKKISKSSTANDEKELYDYLQNLEKTHEKLEKRMLDIRKRIEFLDGVIEREKVKVTELLDKFSKEADQYDLLVSATSKVLMGR